MIENAPHVIKFYFDYLKENPAEILINTAFMFLIPVQDVILPHFYGAIITALESGANFTFPFTVVLVTMVALQIGFYLEDWHDSRLYPKLQDFIRAKMLSRILEKYETSYKELNVGEIISVIVKAPVTMTVWFERIKNIILPFILAFFIAVIYFFTVDIVIGSSLLILGSIFMLSIYLAPKGCTNVTLEREQQLNTIHEEIDDMLRNLFSIYGQDQKENEMKRNKEMEDTHKGLFQQTIDCIFRFKVWITPIAVLFLLIFMFRCMHLISINAMKADKFVPVFIITLYLLNSMVYTNDQFRDIVFEWGVINSANDVVSPIPKSTPKPEYDRGLVPQSGLGLRDVYFKYDSAKYPIFNQISLHINTGEKVIIAGDIGCGKSTLLKLFLKYYEPNEGYVYWQGVSYDDIDVKLLRKSIGYVPQVPILFNRTVLENLTYGLDIPRERVIDFLQEHDIMKEFTNLDNGLDTNIGKNGSKLSGGQRQLVWCVRVLLSNPDIIILDEPTASVDQKTKDLLLRLLDMTMVGKTVIMVTHDEYLISRANRIIYMRQGQIISDKSRS